MKRVFPFVACLSVLFSCKENPDRFEMLDAKSTGIEFNNFITEYDSFNILTYEYIYNGGGVAIADFDNDGLQDIYFTGNMVDNALYINEGDLEFKDVTMESGTTGDDKWCSGVAVVDINEDGWQDIFVCATTYPDADRRRNILYINQGLNNNGIPTFQDQAEAYNVNDTSYTTNAAFFDYDNDGDLDLFMINNKMTDGRTANVFKNKEQTDHRVDKLFKNDWDSLKGHPVFTDVSKDAGIIYEGYSLGLNVTDINQDGWNDIYIANDFLSNDLVYINQRDGTFKDLARQYLKHTSHSAMGTDVTDINNDGLPDIMVVDMLPEDNYRKKTMLGPNNYATYINNEKFGYQYQYVRNTLQLNRGHDPVSNDLVFSEVGFLAGISSTDWSWTPLIADFDNDGYRDVIITNGFPRDVTDRDFIDYNVQTTGYASKDFLMDFIPSVKITNYAFRNTGGFVFEDVTNSWGIKTPSFSNGAAYGDLDNDGDLDYVVNNINDKSFLFKNLTSDKKEGTNRNWVRIRLKGEKGNPLGLGAKVNLYFEKGNKIYSDHSVYRGYLSSVEPVLHFGLGNNDKVDSITVEWPGGTFSKLEHVKANQVITIDISDSKRDTGKSEVAQVSLFKDVSAIFSSYTHEERDFIDFNIQPLLLHKLSQYGPGIATGDVNGDGLVDLYVGGTHTVKGTFFLQDKQGNFKQADLIKGFEAPEEKGEELGVLFFDADDDGDLDLYCVSGGYEYDITDHRYKHMFLENKNGNFSRNANAIPDFLLSGSCVRAADYDRDGDLDLFVGGRVVPHKYPAPVTSYLLRNDSDPTGIRFSVANEEDDPDLTNIGMVCDALWTDFNGDGWIDLMLAGEWMPLKFFQNDRGKFRDVTDSSGISRAIGWWNSIAASDFDGDGDIDYVVGNLGLNTLNRGTDKEPVSIYAADFDNNEGFDMMPTVYYKNVKGEMEEFPFFGRLDVQKEIIKVKAKFLKHAEFGVANIDAVLPLEQRANALVYRANYFSSAYLENKGGGQFSIEALPIETQLAPVYGLIAGDVNDDGNEDVVMVGNDYGTELLMGRYDAFNGLVLSGNGKGEFTPLSIQESGILVKGDAKSLASLRTSGGKLMLVATQNRGVIKAFEQDQSCVRVLDLPADVSRVELLLAGNKTMIKELYYGNGFISQSARQLCISENVKSVTLTTFDGKRSTMDF
jgi:hypothetical protein